MMEILDKKKVTVLGRDMAYYESGAGAPVLFLHGNPTSSYIWRSVMPALTAFGRLIAPDLIGMGDSEKLSDATAETYRFKTHRDYLWAFADAVIEANESVLLVLHDWGGPLGFDWANHHRTRVRGFVYMETIVRPIRPDDGASELRPILQALRSEKGEDLILNHNEFVERILPSLVKKQLTETEMAEYRRPFLKTLDRWPTLTWPRQIPIGGEPADVAAVVESYAHWMSTNDLPKLFVNADPGVILTGKLREFCRTWPNQDEITVAGRHFIQEDSGADIGKAIADWMTKRDLRR